MMSQINEHGFTQGINNMGTTYKNELMSVLLTGRRGQPREGSLHAERSIQGADVSQGGDIIVKTIRLRYQHIKGWIEEQESLKVRP